LSPIDEAALPVEIVEASRAARAASLALTQAAEADDPEGIEQAIALRGEAIARLRVALGRVPEPERRILSARLGEILALDADEASAALERARRRAADGLRTTGEKTRGVRGYTPAGGNAPSSLDRAG
jgi:hypothetical protein